MYGGDSQRVNDTFAHSPKGGKTITKLGMFPIAGSFEDKIIVTCSLLPTTEHGGEPTRVDGALSCFTKGGNAIIKLGHIFCVGLFDANSHPSIKGVVVCSHSTHHNRRGATTAKHRAARTLVCWVRRTWLCCQITQQ
jgi:hypothetical protein